MVPPTAQLPSSNRLRIHHVFLRTAISCYGAFDELVKQNLRRIPESAGQFNRIGLRCVVIRVDGECECGRPR